MFTVDILQDKSIFIDGIFESMLILIRYGTKEIKASIFYKPNNYSAFSKSVIEKTFLENLQMYFHQ